MLGESAPYDQDVRPLFLSEGAFCIKKDNGDFVKVGLDERAEFAILKAQGAKISYLLSDYNYGYGSGMTIQAPVAYDDMKKFVASETVGLQSKVNQLEEDKHALMFRLQQSETFIKELKDQVAELQEKVLGHDKPHAEFMPMLERLSTEPI